jgi:hypothetical protein
MLRKTLFHCTFLLLVSCLATSVNGQTAPASLSATEIVDRNVSARGGLQAWRAAQTMSYSGSWMQEENRMYNSHKHLRTRVSSGCASIGKESMHP